MGSLTVRVRELPIKALTQKMCAFLWFYPTTVHISAHLPPGFQFSIGGGIMTATTNLELIHFSVSNEHDKGLHIKQLVGV